MTELEPEIHGHTEFSETPSVATPAGNWKRELLRLCMNKVTFTLVGLLISAVLIRVYFHSYYHQATTVEARVVRVAKVVQKPIDQTMEVPGTIEAVEQASLFAHVTGYLKKIYVDEGDSVKKGQLMAEIDAPDAMQEYDKIAANYHLNEVTRTRYSELLEDQVISQQEFDQIDAAASESLAKLKNAQANIEYMKIRAPFNGSVARRYKYPGDLISAGTHGEGQTPIFMVVNESKLRVAMNVPQVEISKTGVGHSVDVTVDTLPGTHFPAKISLVDALLDEATKTERILIDLDNPDGRLHAGMFVTVRVLLEHEDHALVVPRESILQEGEQSYVYLVVGGVLKKTNIKTGYVNATFAEAVEGVKVGDVVAVPGARNLQDGMPISPKM